MSKPEASLDILVDALRFRPSEEQVEVKSAFWASQFVKDEGIGPGNVNLAVVYQVTGDSRLEGWWKDQSFRGWFKNKEEFKQRIEAMLFVGLESINEILRDSDAPAAARVKAFELLAKLADKEPPKYKEIKFVDKKIQEMSPAELRKFLESKQALIGGGNSDEEE